MAKNTIIGVGSPFSFKNKEDETINMVRVYVVRQCMDVFGQKAEEVTLMGVGFERIAPYLSDMKSLVGMECEVDRNQKGKLENFEICEVAKAK